MPARSARRFLLDLAIAIVGAVVLWRGAMLEDHLIAAAGAVILVVHATYCVAPRGLLRFTSNVYWKTAITAGSLALLLLGLGHRDPLVVLAGGYSFLSKLTPFYWSGWLRPNR